MSFVSQGNLHLLRGTQACGSLAADAEEDVDVGPGVELPLPYQEHASLTLWHCKKQYHYNNSREESCLGQC